jgi:hypothetical protein
MLELIMKALEQHKWRTLATEEREAQPKWIKIEKVAQSILDELAPALAGASEEVLAALERGAA